jgi:hypothetical protein
MQTITAFDNTAEGWERSLYAFLAKRSEVAAAAAPWSAMAACLLHVFGTVGKPPERVTATKLRRDAGESIEKVTPRVTTSRPPPPFPRPLVVAAGHVDLPTANWRGRPAVPREGHTFAATIMLVV